MHFKGVAHRDIKPENILIVGDKSGGIAKLGDFGTVKCVNVATYLTYKVGTPLYFAPEKISKDYSFPVDLWSIGVILYEMSCGGKHPFSFEGTLDEYMGALPKLKMQ